MRLTGIIVSHSAVMGLMIMQANAGKLNYTVYRADATSFHVASVLVSVEKDAVLVDAQFTLADARIYAMQKLYPDAQLAIALHLGSKVAKGGPGRPFFYPPACIILAEVDD